MERSAARGDGDATAGAAVGTLRPGEGITHGEALALAVAGCRHCHGGGIVLGLRGRERVCGCVLRAICRNVLGHYMKYQEEAAAETIRTVRKVAVGYGRPREEFCADVWVIARRTLDEEEFRAWVLYFMRGADYRACTAALGMSRGNFFHLVYRIEEKLGKAFRMTMPYGLHPVDRYFWSGVKTESWVEVKRQAALEAA